MYVLGFAFVTCSKYFPPHRVSYRGKDAGAKFVEEIIKEKNRILQLIKKEGTKTIIIFQT